MNGKYLLIKELRLALHPAAMAFLALSSMMLIPDYPLYIVFFYTSLGIFFICLTGRENRDISYTISLPVTRCQLVRARMLFAVLLEILQLLLAVPFAVLRQNLPVGTNAVGIDANAAFFGSSMLMLGLFNYVYFTSYYRAPDKVGRAFILGSLAEMLYMLIAETMVHILPFARDVLDAPGTEGMSAKLTVLGIGAAAFVLLTLTAERRAVMHFERLDL
ncbi:MAG: ABC-2 transporter permease [Clostridia bacterium]|nr:ABC-2 transporter permease [Clostridia bacterium]